MVRFPTNIPLSFELVKNYLDNIEQNMNTLLDYTADDDFIPRLKMIYKLHHQRSRYIFELYKNNKIDKELYKYLGKYRFINTELIRHWKRNGYKKLCCLSCIDAVSKNNNVCICRVFKPVSGDTSIKECERCGCSGCWDH